MKKLYPLLLLVFLVSCKKNKELIFLQNKIAGTWEYEKVVGYPFNQPTLPPGNGKFIVIASNGSFKRMQHDTLLFSGKYLLAEKKDCYDRDNNITFTTNENSGSDIRYIEITDNKLSLSTPNCYSDGGTVYYRRVE